MAVNRARFRLVTACAAFGAAVSGPAWAADLDGYAPLPNAVTIHRHHRSYGPGPLPGPRVAVGGPVVVPLDGTGVFFQTPFVDVAAPGQPDAIVRLPHYQKPDGSYDGLYGLSSAIQGYPCGQECTNRALVNWGYAPAY